MENIENNNIPEINPEDVVETGKKKIDWKKEIREWIVTIVVAALIAFILQTFFMQIACVSGPSMEATLQDKDVLYVNKFMYTPEKGDVVIVNTEKLIDKNDPYYEQKLKEKYHVKRIIATAGDTLYIDDENGDVYVNGELIDEPYINNRTNINGAFLFDLIMNGDFSLENPLVLKENEIFVMGDNRQHSLDSRANGPYTVDMIEGHAVFRMWPISEIGNFDKD